MDAPLLLTKLRIPPPGPIHINRTRLLELLPQRATLRLALVTAPAGFGKTTLLAEWVRLLGQTGTAVAWYTLDPSDDDLLRFLAHLIRACASAFGQRPALETLLSDLLSDPQTRPEPVLTALLNDLTLAEQPCLLVLDDYHRIGNPAIHSALSFLLDHLPAGVSLALGTRADPPLALTRLRARGQLVELRAADLRFTRTEQEDFLAQAVRRPIAADDRQQIDAVTEGWAAGIQLIALTLDRPAPVTPHATVRQVLAQHAQGQRQIFDYLAEEVFAQQPPEIQHFLLVTSILDRMCGELCDAVRDEGRKTKDEGSDSDAGAFVFRPSSFVLSDLERANLFLIPLDDTCCWYRYHHLFAEFLRERLWRTQGDVIPSLHRRASAWFATQMASAGLPVSIEAVRHALAAREFADAARLIDQTIGVTMVRGELALLLGWLTALPLETLQAWPHLAIYQARVLLLAGQVAAAEQRLSWIESQLPDDDPQHGVILAHRATQAAICGESRQALALVAEAQTRVPVGDRLTHARVAFAAGFAYLHAGALEQAEQACAETMRLGQDVGQLALVFEAAGTRSIIQTFRGRLRAANQLSVESLALAEAHGLADLPAVALVYLAQAAVRYEWNDLAGAEQCVRRGMALRRRSGMVGENYLEHPALAQILLARGDPAGATEAIAAAERVAQTCQNPADAAMITVNLVRVYLTLGNLAAARSWAERCEYVRAVNQASGSGIADRSARISQGLLAEHEDLHLTRVWLACGRNAEAATLAAQISATSGASGRVGHQIEALALVALACAAQGQENPSQAALAEALSLAAPEGYVRTFVDMGPPMYAQLVTYRQALSSAERIQLVACDRLLAAFSGENVCPATPPPQPSALSPQPLTEPLSERELEVLRLIAAGLTNVEIAHRLVIALPTVKSHVLHIYGKLGVNQRRAAIEQARRLGLLGAG